MRGEVARPTFGQEAEPGAIVAKTTWFATWECRRFTANCVDYLYGIVDSMEGRMAQIGLATAIAVVGGAGSPRSSSATWANASAMMGPNTGMAAAMTPRQRSHGLNCRATS